MDTKMYAAILRLQSEQLQKLVRELTAKLVAFEAAMAIHGPASEAITTLHMDGVGELGQNIEAEVARLQNYIHQPPHQGN
jgi:hypothetical protein